MKKTIITMLIALVAIMASAETYNYLKFTRKSGSTVTFTAQGLKLTYDDSNITVTNADGTATIPLADVEDMYFSNEGGTTPTVLLGDVDMDGEVTIADVTALLDYLLSGNATGLDLAAADADGDTTVSIADVSIIIDMLLSAGN